MFNTLIYNAYKIIGKITRKYPTNMNVLFRKNQINVASNARIFSNILTMESFLISVGNNTTIASNVKFITHDASIGKFVENKTDLLGGIKIGDNCFIGAHSIIMYGVEIADQCIVAAGSVVTKSFLEKGNIIAGNPARIIGNVKDFVEKKSRYAINRKDYNKLSELKDALFFENKLVKR